MLKDDLSKNEDMIKKLKDERQKQRVVMEDFKLIGKMKIEEY